MPSPTRPAGKPEAPKLDLPDLDTADDSGEVDVGVFELSMGEELDLEEGEGTLDGFEIGIQERDDPGSDEAATDLEIGMAELLDALPEEPPAHEGDAPVPLANDLDLHLDTPLEADDTSTDAELGDDGLEDLPELLEEGDEGDAGPELEGTLLPGAPEGRIPTGPRLEPEWLLLGAPCSALWAFGGEVLGSGDHLMRFGDERRSEALPSGTRASSLCRDGAGNVVLATNRGLLEVTAAGASSWLDAPEPGRGSGEVVDLCGAPGTPTLWARLASGTLLRRRGSNWERHEAGGTVRSLSSTQGDITLLVVAQRPTLQLSSDGGSSFSERLLPEPAATVALGAAPLALSLGPALVISDPERGVCVSLDDGASFSLITGAVNATAAALGEHEGRLKLFVALYREGRDTTEVVAVELQTLATASVAELSGEADEDAEETGRTSALIVADGSLWAAGGFGLAKLR